MSTIFDLRITVQPEHIDVLGHVNNVMYIQWMQMSQQHILKNRDPAIFRTQTCNGGSRASCSNIGKQH